MWSFLERLFVPYTPNMNCDSCPRPCSLLNYISCDQVQNLCKAC